MSQSELRDLLRDRVADETTVDLSSTAWRAGQRFRRRRSLAVGAGVVAGAVAVSGAVAWVGSSSEPDAGPPVATPSGPTTTTTANVFTEAPDATYQGVDVWWSPDQAEERQLPFVQDSPLPRTINLDIRGKQLDGPVVMAFALGRSVVLMDAFGFAVSVDIARLDQVDLPHGYLVDPVSWRMLSPGGTRLLFPQDDHLEIYDIEKGQWSQYGGDLGLNWSYTMWEDDQTIAVPPATTGGEAPRFHLSIDDGLTPADFEPWAPGFDTREAQPVGGTVLTGPDNKGRFLSRAQVWGMGGIDLPVREGSTSDPELMAFTGPGVDGVLAFTGVLGDGSDTRWKDCCLAVGWLDDDTLVYLSRQAEHTLVAWTVGTHEFRRVTTITGGQGDSVYDAASFASLD